MPISYEIKNWKTGEWLNEPQHIIQGGPVLNVNNPLSDSASKNKLTYIYLVLI